MKTQLQHHLKEGLTSLLKAQKLHNCLSIEQAMNLSNAIDRIDSLITEIEPENPLIPSADVVGIDRLLKACQ
jgi:hypothetical protein